MAKAVRLKFEGLEVLFNRYCVAVNGYCIGKVREHIAVDYLGNNRYLVIIDDKAYNFVLKGDSKPRRIFEANINGDDDFNLEVLVEDKKLTVEKYENSWGDNYE